MSMMRRAVHFGLTARQVRRLARRYAAPGPVGLISKRFSRPSNNRLNDAMADQVGRREAQTKHGVDLARETVRQLQIAGHLVNAPRSLIIRPTNP